MKNRIILAIFRILSFCSVWATIHLTMFSCAYKPENITKSLTFLITSIFFLGIELYILSKEIE